MRHTDDYIREGNMSELPNLIKIKNKYIPEKQYYKNKNHKFTPKEEYYKNEHFYEHTSYKSNYFLLYNFINDVQVIEKKIFINKEEIISEIYILSQYNILQEVRQFVDITYYSKPVVIIKFNIPSRTKSARNFPGRLSHSNSISSNN